MLKNIVEIIQLILAKFPLDEPLARQWQAALHNTEDPDHLRQTLVVERVMGLDVFENFEYQLDLARTPSAVFRAGRKLGAFDLDKSFYMESLGQLISQSLREHPAPFDAGRALRSKLDDSVGLHSQSRQPGVPKYKLVSKLLLPGVCAAIEKHTESVALARLAALGLEFNLLGQRSGRYPDHLPIDNSTLPAATFTDPFTGNPFLLKPTTNQVVLYSVGADLVDDQGKDTRKSKFKAVTDLVFTLPKAAPKSPQ